MHEWVKLGWAFLGLCCGVLVVYVLNRGVFVGSTMDRVLQGAGGGLSGYHVMVRRCRYLYPSGVVVRSERGLEHETTCRMFNSH